MYFVDIIPRYNLYWNGLDTVFRGLGIKLTRNSQLYPVNLFLT